PPADRKRPTVCRRRRDSQPDDRRGRRRRAPGRGRPDDCYGRRLMRRALAFLTPIGGAVPPSPDAVRWFPIAGLLIGLAVGGVWWGAAKFWPPAVAAALAVVADLALTGMLHFDGLVDSADGLVPPLPRRRRHHGTACSGG